MSGEPQGPPKGIFCPKCCPFGGPRSAVEVFEEAGAHDMDTAQPDGSPSGSWAKIRRQPKFTFSHFTRDPNLHMNKFTWDPNLHITEFTRDPNLHDIKFTRNPNLHKQFTQHQICTGPNLHKKQIYKNPIFEVSGIFRLQNSQKG